MKFVLSGIAAAAMALAGFAPGAKPPSAIAAAAMPAKTNFMGTSLSKVGFPQS